MEPTATHRENNIPANHHCFYC